MPSDYKSGKNDIEKIWKKHNISFKKNLKIFSSRNYC